MFFLRKCCKSKAKLNHDIKRICLSTEHNQGLDNYNDNIYSIKRKCKEAAISSGESQKDIQ